MTKAWCSRVVTRVVLASGILLLEVPGADAKKHCTCIMSTGGGSWASVQAGQIHSLGQIASYQDMDVNAPSKCSGTCSDMCSGQDGVNALGGAANACALMGWQGGCVRCYGYIGNIGDKN